MTTRYKVNTDLQLFLDSGSAHNFVIPNDSIVVQQTVNRAEVGANILTNNLIFYQINVGR